MIALAVACSPALLIADEPTTGLDVTTQAAILELIDELRAQSRMAMVLITHDLALAGERCDRIVVMHAGHVVETAPTAELFASPRHPVHRAAARVHAASRGDARRPASDPRRRAGPARDAAAVPLPVALRARRRRLRRAAAAAPHHRRRAHGRVPVPL